MSADNAPAPTSFDIRTFQAGDLSACRSLYSDGLIGGKLADNDTGFDIDDIQSAYLSQDGCHFWVAVAPAAPAPPAGESPFSGGDGKSAPGACPLRVVGMIGVQQHEPGVGEIRRLRVAPSHRRRGIGSALVEQALTFCQARGYLKITLDTFVDHEPAIRLFRKFHFRHERTRKVGEREMLYFYLDLYAEDRKEP